MAQRVLPRVHRGYFELLYARKKDPWDYETRDYERDKYARTLDVLGDRIYDRALEVGCSIGVFTRLVAPRCAELRAVDASSLAIGRARERLRDLPHVRVERRTLPEQMPPGSFDLIICSEVLYYWDYTLLLRAIRTFEATLDQNGVFLAVHGRFDSRTCPLTGDEVHDFVKASSALNNIQSITERQYRIDLYQK